MINDDRQIKLRNFVLSALVPRSGMYLSPELINELTQDIVERTNDLISYFVRHGEAANEANKN